MRLQKVQDELKEKGWEYRYTEEAGLGSIDFEDRGISYHTWEQRATSVPQEGQRTSLVRIMKNRLCSW